MGNRLSRTVRSSEAALQQLLLLQWYYIGSSVSAEMHGFYIYKKVAARDPGRIQVFSHLAIRRIQEIFVQRQIRLTAGSLNFCPCLFDAPRGKSTFLLFREFDVSRTLFY